MDIKKIAVIGAGEMGHGIAEVFAISGFYVNLIDLKQTTLDSAMSNVLQSINKLAEKGKMTDQQAKESYARMKTFTDMQSGLKDVDFVVEAVPENLDLKSKIFTQAENFIKDDTVISSNTSNIRITQIASAMKHPERAIGTHFFNPAVIMKLVEVVRGEKTNDKTFEIASELIKRTGKTPVSVKKDTPGFIVNRINAADLLLFGLIIDKGIAKPEEVDAFAKGQGMVMGPYELIDFVGVDIVKDSLDYYAKEISPDYGKVKVYSDMVSRKLLGKKSGAGFYDWTKGRPAILTSANPTDKLSLMDLFSVEINEAVKLLEENIATPDEIETAVKLGMNRPFGPISVAKSLTNSEVKEKLDELAKRFDCDVFKPSVSISQGKMLYAIDGGLHKESETPSGEKQSGFKYVTIERNEKVARLLINRPKLNLINLDVLDELDRAIASLWSDQSVNVLLVMGEGGILSAGADLSSYFANDAQFIAFSKKGQNTFKKLSEIPKITIAVMEGYALGGGFELSLACDLRVATSSVVMGFPEVTHGLIPAWGGSQRIAKLIGGSYASRLVLTSERITGKEASDFGLISKIFDSDIVSNAMQYAKEISINSAPIAAALGKTLVNKSVEISLEAGLDLESIASGIIFNTEDLREGLSSFMQKKKPEFKGR